MPRQAAVHSSNHACSAHTIASRASLKQRHALAQSSCVAASLLMHAPACARSLTVLTLSSTAPVCATLPWCNCQLPVMQDGWPSMREVVDIANVMQEGGARRLNREQRIAVASLLCGNNGSAFACTPFALFGPPGTGKCPPVPGFLLNQGCLLVSNAVHVHLGCSSMLFACIVLELPCCFVSASLHLQVFINLACSMHMRLLLQRGVHLHMQDAGLALVLSDCASQHCLRQGYCWCTFASTLVCLHSRSPACAASHAHPVRDGCRQSHNRRFLTASVNRQHTSMQAKWRVASDGSASRKRPTCWRISRRLMQGLCHAQARRSRWSRRLCRS